MRISFERSRRERWATVILLVSLLCLMVEAIVLQSEHGLDFVLLSAMVAAFVGVPQIIMLSAVGLAVRKTVIVVAAIGSALAFALALDLIHDVFTSTSSTAGVALFFWPMEASVVAVLLLIGATLIDRVFNGGANARG